MDSMLFGNGEHVRRCTLPYPRFKVARLLHRVLECRLETADNANGISSILAPRKPALSTSSSPNWITNTIMTTRTTE
jgi:hypothetical protein